MAEIILKDLCKNFGNVKAVIDLNLEIKDEEMLCFLGPSGCGKTTSLRMIAGLERPSSGSVHIGGDDVTNLPPRDRDIAMVFENYALYPQMTVYQNIAFPLRVKKMDPARIREKVMRAANILEIAELLERGVSQLSGGQKQRVAMGRAIVRSPKVFLMDEPISHLDAKLRTHMRGEIKRLQKDLETTMVYVTHDQLEAMSMADRIAVMNLGVLQQLATPDDIFNNPVNDFVAGFIGDPPINFIDCHLVEEGGQTHLRNGEFSIALPAEFAAKLKSGVSDERLRMGIRPTHFKIHKEKPELPAIPAEVYISEPLGEVQIIDFSFQSAILKMVTSPDVKVDMKENIWLSFDLKRVHVFDGATGKRLS